MSALFMPLSLRGVTLRNRVAMPPMCQYMASEGFPTAWHMAHLGARAAGGVGLIVVEMTAVEPQGRITPGCMGLWSDAHAVALQPIVDFISSQGSVPGIQIAHAGRKAGRNLPWKNGGETLADGWLIPAPSAVPYGRYAMPFAMTPADMDRMVEAFAAATRRAVTAGFQLIELHGAHGYLLHQFLSPLSNLRTDGFGGSLENRAVFPLRVVRAMRAALPDNLPLMVRLSCDDWTPGGFTLEEAVIFCRWMKDAGVDIVDCSSGGNSPNEQIPAGPGYQVPLSAAIRQGAGIATGAVGFITEPEQAEAILTEGKADIVHIGRALLENPNWALDASDLLSGGLERPLSYRRAVQGLRVMRETFMSGSEK